jgi:hypothetical protein
LLRLRTPRVLLSSNDVQRRSLIAVARFLLLAVASVLLYYGLGMLLLVPGDPGGPYWVRNRVVYGVIPLFAGLLALAVSSWAATHYKPQTDPVRAISRNLLYGVIGIVLVFVSLIFNDLYVHLPIRIP